MAKYFHDNPGTIDYVYDYTFGYYPAGVGIEQFAQGPIPVGIFTFCLRNTFPKELASISNYVKFEINGVRMS